MINRFPLKTKTIKNFSFILFLFILVACSTTKNSFLSRNSHALSTKYNIDYNGQIALDKGIANLKFEAKDNFWKRLPVEQMQISTGSILKSKNTNFELAEAKATKAIQKHSMNIDGNEKNSQMDESYILLGKSRYYDQRYIPALDAFNYILYKYPNSDKFYQAKIWREKTNMRLGNDVQVIKNISLLVKDKKLKKQNIADSNALLSESFLNLEEKDSAISKLKKAEKFTKLNSEKARYRFILGQLYQELGKKDSADYFYQSVITMKRKADRIFTIQAYMKKAEMFDFDQGNTANFIATFDTLIDDRENRPYLDIIYYNLGVFYDKQNNQELAQLNYNKSLKKKSTDSYLMASNYRNIADIFFKNTEYAEAAKYYDSTLVNLNAKTREAIHIKKVRTDLDEVIEFETIAKTNDSILNVLAMTGAKRIFYYETFIDKLKTADEKKKLIAEKEKEKVANIDRNSLNAPDDLPIAATGIMAPKRESYAPPAVTSMVNKDGSNTFYFYNPSTIAFGKIEFNKRWGKRVQEGYWRISGTTANSVDGEKGTIDNAIAEKETASDKIPEQYTVDFYLNKLPKEQNVIDDIVKERNLAYYQLGIIYKEKFKEYTLASDKLEQLLAQNPEERLILPSMYNLYKIYQITNSSKANEMKASINAKYPDSRYAQIINNTTVVTSNETPAAVYDKLYKLYESEQFASALEKIDTSIINYYGDEIVPKLELLKAYTIGKLRGLDDYKKALQFVVDNYPNSEEGKKAQDIIIKEIPRLQKMAFTKSDSKNWKILYRIDAKDDKTPKKFEDKVKKLILEDNFRKLKFSVDDYSEKENFIKLQGIQSENDARGIAFILKDDKRFKIVEEPILISSDNYYIVQIKKNLEEYLKSKNEAVIPQIKKTTEPINSDIKNPDRNKVPAVEEKASQGQKSPSKS